MSLDALTGTTYGPFPVAISRAKVAEFVTATGDDPARWVDAAPPGYAGALLFAVAPAFLGSTEVSGHTAVLIHADQTFTWHSPLAVGAGCNVTGTVARVRSRGGMSFVSFAAHVEAGDGAPMLDSESTFILGAEARGEAAPERAEPPVDLDAGFGELNGYEPTLRSVSRLGLVRYAAASGDFNPIHFDHDAARAAGLSGIVVHGLLMAAWLLQPVSAAVPGDAPLASVKVRFREPLLAAEAAVVAGEPRDDGRGVDLQLTRSGDGVTLVTCRAMPREA